MKKTLFLWSLLGLLMLNIAWAQQKTIRGTVLDETDSPLPGATVIIDGTTQGVSTDFDGNFSINTTLGDVLVVSYVGYADQRITVGDQDNMTINLTFEGELNEVVVTGVAQGTAVRKLGFSIGKVNNDALNEVPAADPANALRGKVSGVSIVQASGNPASAPQIRLRGSTSISGSQSPLIIIDGIISDGSLRDIAVEDIETINYSQVIGWLDVESQKILIHPQKRTFYSTMVKIG